MRRRRQDIRVLSLVVLPKKYSRVLVGTSSTTILTVLKAAEARFWGCTFISALLLFTSINYWRDARYGFRRDLDMAIAVLTLLWFTITAFRLQVYEWYIGVFLCGLCYSQARRSLTPVTGMGWHAGMHLVGNAANLYMFSQVIP